ncbi:MAG: hotdog fold thioesterase [Steroidobacteraceae bacterium]
MSASVSLWIAGTTLEGLNARHRNTMAAHLGIVFTELGDGFLRATLPVDSHTVQPMGVLHGGVSAMFAETLANAAAISVIDDARYDTFVQESNANHLRPGLPGLVIGTARPHHLGARSHVWGVEIADERDRLICIARCTLAIVKRTASGPR